MLFFFCKNQAGFLITLVFIRCFFKHNYPYLGRGRSFNFRFLDFWAVHTSKAAAAAGPFEQLPQLLGHSNGCPRTSKRQLYIVISMLVVVIKAANVSSAAALFVFPPLSAAAHNVSRFRVVLGAEFLPLYHSAVAKASSATASPPAPPRQLLLLLLLLLLLVSILRKFLKVNNRLSVVMTSPSLSSLLHTRSMAECLCVGSMGGRKLAVIMALVLSVTGHLRRKALKCWLRRSPLLQQRIARTRIVCFGSPNTAAALSIYLHQDSSQIAHTSTSTRKLLNIFWAGHPSTSQCIFQDLEIPGRLQQHQITIIYLACPYSSTITNTYFPYFRYYTRINYIAV